MRFSTRRIRFSKRQSKSKMAFPVVAIVQKRVKPKYIPLEGTHTKYLQPAKNNRTLKLPQGTIDYKNVLLLRKLISAEGKILPRRINKLTAKQQRHIAKAIKNARLIGLLPFINKSFQSGLFYK